jgi:hypothetical protein
LYLVDIQGKFSEYLAGNFSGKSRQNLNRAVRKVSALVGGKPPWRVYMTPDEMPEFHREAAALSARTYQSRFLGVGLESNAATLAELQRAAQDGAARGYLLRVGEETIAFAWCHKTAPRRLYYETIGYSADHANLSPGTVLLYFILSDLFASGEYDCLDFGSGEAPYKAMFSTRRAVFVDAYVLKLSPAHWLALHAHRALNGATDALGRTLDRWGLKRELKSALRRFRGLG